MGRVHFSVGLLPGIFRVSGMAGYDGRADSESTRRDVVTGGRLSGESRCGPHCGNFKLNLT